MQQHTIYIISCAHGQMARLATKPPVTARKDIYVFHHWTTATPGADLMQAAKILKPWHVSGELYAMDAAQVYATLVDKIKTLKAQPIIKWQAMEQAGPIWNTTALKAVLYFIASFAIIPLAIIIAIHLGAIAGVATGGVFALILRAIKS